MISYMPAGPPGWALENGCHLHDLKVRLSISMYPLTDARTVHPTTSAGRASAWAWLAFAVYRMEPTDVVKWSVTTDAHGSGRLMTVTSELQPWVFLLFAGAELVLPLAAAALAATPLAGLAVEPAWCWVGAEEDWGRTAGGARAYRGARPCRLAPVLLVDPCCCPVDRILLLSSHYSRPTKGVWWPPRDLCREEPGCRATREVLRGWQGLVGLRVLDPT